jgi:hypothetical protein
VNVSVSSTQTNRADRRLDTCAEMPACCRHHDIPALANRTVAAAP